MASFPDSVKSFTTKNAADVIQAAHVNDLQDEANAIEAGYLNGTARLNSSNSTMATLSVTGGSTVGSLTVAAGGPISMTGAASLGTINAGGSTLTSLTVTGGSTLASLHVSNNSTVGGNLTANTLTVNGNSTFGGSIGMAGTSSMAALSVTTFGQFAEVSTCAAAPADSMRIYCRDNGSGKQQLVVIFPSGAGQIVATEP